jgi:hypothetical protein
VTHKPKFPPPQGRSWRDDLPIHPAAELLPLIADDDLRVLGEDIVKTGLRLPIVLWRAHPKGEALLLDGRNRLDAIELVTGKTVEVGAPSIMAGDFLACDKVVELDSQVDPWAYIVSVNIYRRDLKVEERQNALIKLIARTPEKSDRQFGKEIGVDHKTISKARAKGEATGEVSPVEKRVGGDGKSRKRPAKKSNRPKASDPPSSSAKTLQKRNAARRLKFAANGKKTLYCLFCDKSQHEVECLITHREDNWVAICDECVAACVKTIAEQKTKQNTPPPPPADDGLGIPDFLDRSKQMEIAS